MLHTKFCGNRSTGSGEEDFLNVFAIHSHGGHLGYVTWTIYIHFRSWDMQGFPISLIFGQNIDCVYIHLTCTQDQCFEQKY